jgi:glycosyltransferase involved in cell wall biosynthesis
MKMTNGSVPATKVGIIYWGTKGAGVEFVKIIKKASESYPNHEIYISAKEESFKSSEVLAPKKIYQVFAWLKTRNQVVNHFRDKSVDVVIIPMLSPWDIGIAKKLIRLGIPVTRVIHDATRHPGDIWPTNNWIKRAIRDSSKVVVLSAYCEKRVIQHSHGIQVVRSVHPEFVIENFKKGKIHNSPGDSVRFLYIGRGRKYQGLELLLQAWDVCKIKNSSLTIRVGSGRTVGSSRKIDFEKGWMGHDDFVSLIDRHDIIILPYLESSQSGVASLATQLGKPVVCTPVGGLMEQIQNSINGIVSDDLSPIKFAEALLKATQIDWNPEHIKASLPRDDFYVKCIS